MHSKMWFSVIFLQGCLDRQARRPGEEQERLKSPSLVVRAARSIPPRRPDGCGTDKCHICMGICNDLDSIFGLICIILRFMPIFLRLRLVSASSGFGLQIYV